MNLTGKETLIRHMSYKPVSVDDISVYVLGRVKKQTVNLINSLQAAEAIGGHRVVVRSDGAVRLADNAVLEQAHSVIGLTLNAAVQNGAVDVQSNGVVTEPSWNWLPDKPIFVGTNGLLTQTPPSSGFSLVFAKPFSSNSIYIDIQEPILLGS